MLEWKNDDFWPRYYLLPGPYNQNCQLGTIHNLYYWIKLNYTIKYNSKCVIHKYLLIVNRLQYLKIV